MQEYHQRMGSRPAQGQQSLIDMTSSQRQQLESDARGRKRQVDGQPVPTVTQPGAFVYNSGVER